MKKVILDTSFILSAVRNKIDFFEDLKMMGMQILIPDRVIKELKGLKAELALKLLHAHKFKQIKIKGKNTDRAIMNYAKENPRIIVATLDRELKKSIKSPKLVIRQKKKLDII
jgi:rRNA-processing protein FCF1